MRDEPRCRSRFDVRQCLRVGRKLFRGPERYQLVYSTAEGDEGPLDLLAFDAIHDVALVRAAGPGLRGVKPLNFRPKQKALSKGERIFVEGSLRTSSYEKDGEKRYRTEVVANNIILAGRGKGGEAGEGGGYERRAPRSESGGGGGRAPASREQQSAPPPDDFGDYAGGGDDDIPF